MMSFPYKIIDLTHDLCPDVPTWVGGCGFDHSIKSDYDHKSLYQFRTHTIKMQEGIGTHIDSPAHCFLGKQTVERLHLEDLCTHCLVIDISSKAHESYKLSARDILEFEDKNGFIDAHTFVIIYSGWEKFWQQPDKYRNQYRFPSISLEAAEVLLERHVNGLGIDTLSPDTGEDGFPVHKAFLGAGKYLIENVANAHLLPEKGSFSLALPLKIQGGTEAPVRLVGLVPIK